jgi:hypothetical protein
MKLVHTPSTRAPVAPTLPEVGARPFVGAVKRDRHCDNDPDFYETFKQEDLLEIADGRRDYLVGDTEDEITEQLERRFPRVHDNAVRVARATCCSLRVDGKTWRGGHKWEREEFDGWVILEEGLPLCLEQSMDIWKQVSADVGSFLVWVHDVQHHSTKTLAEEGFTCSHYCGDFYRVRYNPGAIARRPYNEELRHYKKRVQGFFPKELLNALYGMLSPQRWPDQHPFKEVLCGKDLYHTRGWGHRVDNDFDVSEVLSLIEANRKLWKEKFWRAHKSWRGENENKDDIRKLLEYVHGVETNADEKEREFWESERSRYGHYRRRWHENPENYATKKPVPFSQFHVPPPKDTVKQARQLCRWLRREARAMGIKMPRKPERPLTPRQQEKKRCRKRKKRRGAR